MGGTENLTSLVKGNNMYPRDEMKRFAETMVHIDDIYNYDPNLVIPEGSMFVSDINNITFFKIDDLGVERMRLMVWDGDVWEYEGISSPDVSEIICLLDMIYGAVGIRRR